jgi:hypothetical protein
MVTMEEFTGCFVRNLLVCRETRSIVSALYSWLLESNDLRNELLLRGHARGSMEPFVLHLLKGGLIYESVLRRFYIGSSLSDLCKTREFKRDFDNIVVKSGAPNYRHIYESIAGRSVQSALDVATQLRNLSGHDLARDDIFDEHAIYSRLTEQLADATLIALKLYGARSIRNETDATA